MQVIKVVWHCAYVRNFGPDKVKKKKKRKRKKRNKVTCNCNIVFKTGYPDAFLFSEKDMGNKLSFPHPGLNK